MTKVLPALKPPWERQYPPEAPRETGTRERAIDFVYQKCFYQQHKLMVVDMQHQEGNRDIDLSSLCMCYYLPFFVEGDTAGAGGISCSGVRLRFLPAE